MFVLLGDPLETAKKNATTVMTIETALAKNALDTTSQRDPNKIYHLMKVADFDARAAKRGVTPAPTEA